MSFEIMGQISEKGTGKPLPGLIVQACDKNMWFDDCLGATTTDLKGYFKLEYSEREFREVFEKQPEIYLAVYEPPFTHLLNTTQTTLWKASGRANFPIVIDGKRVSDPAARSQKNQIHGGVSLSSRQLKIETVNDWHIPHLGGFSNGNLYGSPSILEQVQYVLLPAGAQVSKVEIILGPVERKGRNIKPFPIQRPHLDLPDGDAGRGKDPEFVNPDPRYYRGTQPYPEKLVTLGHVEEWMGVQKVQVRVRPLQYDPVSRQYLFYPKLSYIVHYLSASHEESGTITTLKTVHNRRFICQNFVDFLRRKDVHAYPGAFADQFAKPGLPEMPGSFYLKTPYLIITDNYEWSETNLPAKNEPTGQVSGTGNIQDPGDIQYIHPPTEPGDELDADAMSNKIVNHFRRLAKWKRQRGIRTKVVTVSEIVENKDGIYGDLLKRRDVSALDLQEVIRNFIWWAHDNLGVEYVLLGGDTNIIPMRKLIGYVTDQGNASGWDCMRDQNDDLVKRDQCKYYEGQDFTKIHYCGGSDIPTLPLLTHQGGKQIKYYQDVPPNHFPRWFCVDVDSNEEFKDLAKPFIPWNPPQNPNGEERHYYVIVEDNGYHLADINDDYYWVSDGRRIPTDRYYACAGSPAGMGTDEQDFDRNGNHFYGQFRWDEEIGNDVPIDGFMIATDIFIGRAPVRSGAEAKAFVDKVISYEQLEQVDDAPEMNLDYLRKIVHVADYSSHYTQKSGLVQGEATAGTDVNHPPEGKYTYNDAGWARIQIKKDSSPDKNLTLNDGEVNFRLIFNDGDVERSIPYASNEETGERWYFMHEDFTDGEMSEEKTRFIQVDGLSKKPGNFFWDKVGFDGFHERSNNLRQRMIELYPEFNQIKRIYTDHFEPVEPGMPAVIQLTKEKLKTELSEGCHFLALHGHGSPNGCCKLTATDTYTNNKGIYIAYAHSCSTARPDDYEMGGAEKQHSFGEALVVQEGGAVAYIGSARMDGDHLDHGYADYLWEQIQDLRRLGPSSADCDYGGGDFWHFYCRTLYGDPEMPVWIKMPKSYFVSAPTSAARGNDVVITVKKLVLKPTIPSHQKALPNSPIIPLKDHLVTLMAGWNPLGTDEDWKKGPELFLTAKTDSQGKVQFAIPETLQANKVEITVCACSYSKVPSQYDYKPVTRMVTITS
ncbi:MAG: C25 family cysteine peptidase [Methanothrix sp.]|uniref:C25 family cysteine peptidase n=1 Tax=Methanothrix sp. TaxID=90426 RepID=UPI003BB5FF32